MARLVVGHVLLLGALWTIGSRAAGAQQTPPASRECGLPAVADVSAWMEQTITEAGFAFKLPDGFVLDTGREEKFVHGGHAWRQGDRSLEELQGHWSASSFRYAPRCAQTIGGIPVVLMWEREDNGGVTFAAWLHDEPEPYDTILSGNSPRFEDLALFQRVVQTVRKAAWRK